jgi:hypothetical protein
MAKPRHAARRLDKQKFRGIDSTYSFNWLGNTMTKPITCDTTVMDNPVYTYIEGQFASPSPSGGYAYTTSKVAEWIGIGGKDSLTILIQAGADGVTQCFRYYCITTSVLWKEAYPDSLSTLRNQLQTQPGDWLELSITITDHDGNPNPSGPEGRLWLLNYTRQQLISSEDMAIAKSDWAYTNYHFAGESAEWIIERVGDPDCTKRPANARLCLFANFGSSHMTRTATFAANCPWPLNYLQPGNTVRQENILSCDSSPYCPYIGTMANGSETYDHRADMTFNWQGFY